MVIHQMDQNDMPEYGSHQNFVMRQIEYFDYVAQYIYIIVCRFRVLM